VLKVEVEVHTFSIAPTYTCLVTVVQLMCLTGTGLEGMPGPPGPSGLPGQKGQKGETGSNYFILFRLQCIT
jgi:hypothetical protein